MEDITKEKNMLTVRVRISSSVCVSPMYLCLCVCAYMCACVCVHVCVCTVCVQPKSCSTYSTKVALHMGFPSTINSAV